MTKLAALFSFLCAALAGCCFGQRPSTLAFDTSNMKVTIAMDREVYFPGEVAQITLTVTNPTKKRVRSLRPFLSSTTCLVQGLKGGPPPRLEGECASVPLDRSNTTAFGPGESKQIVLKSYDQFTEIRSSAMLGSSVVTHPGSYVLVFRYGASTSEVEYSIAPTILDADEVVRLRDGLQHFGALPPRPFPDYAHVLALRSDGVTYICVQQQTVSNSKRVVSVATIPENLDFDDSHVNIRSATPFKRIATSDAAIVKLSATAEAQENLTIEWTDANGELGHVFYPASYPARDPLRNQ